ncbi:cytosolic carboxypeptidase-like protein 5 isoform X5 [Bolinopsis microptera]|uniref:cytosolic carboxypeptidase-like protein 5 isoform X5 n=1 Tax=Bolinopsis microptera TaxID=2820187 RepID=UPI003078C060
MAEERFGSVVFRQNFDSGNFGSVEKIENSNEDDLLEFKVWTRPDCAGSCYENGNRTWFHFSVSGVPSHKTLKITMCNLNKQSKLYSQGMMPVYRVVPGKIKWERVRDRPTYEMIDGQFHLTFLHTVLDSKITTYFAFVYPFSYTDLQKKLDLFEARFINLPWNLPSWKRTEEFPKDAIYYHSTTLCHTLKNLKVQLLTISSPHGMTDERELPLQHLFPDGPSSLPRRFNGKKVYFISSRVHPGEVPASFVMNGFLSFILRPRDPRAVLLRQLFVFKVVPMLNPDGVNSGHYRTDSRGVNLNRYYINPCPKLHPSIYGAKAIIMYHHRGGRDCKCGADTKFKISRQPAETSPTNLGDGSSTTTSSSSRSSGCAAKGPDLKSIISCEGDNQRLNKQVQSILQNLRKDIDCSDEEFQLRMEARVSEICSKMAQLNQQSLEKTDENDKRKRANPVQLRTAVVTSSQTELTDPDQNIEVRACVCGVAPEPLPVNKQLLVNGGGVPENIHSESGIEMYVDLHGHASKRGCFIYGNNLVDERQIENILYPRLIAYNSVHFDFSGCCFTERNMYAKDKSDGLSKEGSGRVGIFKSTGIIHSYTLECNYNMGRQLNQLPAASKDNGRATPPVTASFPPKYTPDSWEEVGKALAVGLLDMHNVNPWSRLLNTDVVNVHGLRGLMLRTSKGNNSTGPGVLRRLAYATSKIMNNNSTITADNSKPPRPGNNKVRQNKGPSSESRHNLRRITNASRTDLSKHDHKDSLDTESDSCSKSDITNTARDTKRQAEKDKLSESETNKAFKMGESESKPGECTDSSSGGNTKQDKSKRDRSTLLRQTSASLAKRSEKSVRKQTSYEDSSRELKETNNSTDGMDLKNEITVQYRSLYSGVYKLDVEEEPYSCVKKIFPTTTIKPVIPPTDKHASLCNFIDLSDNNKGPISLTKDPIGDEIPEVDLTQSRRKVSLSPKTVSCGQPAVTSHVTHSKIPRKSSTTGYYPALRQGRLTRKSVKGKNREWLREWHANGDSNSTGNYSEASVTDSLPSNERPAKITSLRTCSGVHSEKGPIL